VVLERLRQSTVTISECEATMDRIRAVVSAELLEIPGSLAEALAGKDPAFTQLILERSIHKSLEPLSMPEFISKRKPNKVRLGWMRFLVANSHAYGNAHRRSSP